MLLEEHGGYLALPHAVAGTVVELEPATQSEELRRRHRALEHLPLSSELRFAEIDVAPLVSRRAAQLFAGKVREPEAARRLQDAALKQNITTLHNRINKLGVAEPVIQQQGIDEKIRLANMPFGALQRAWIPSTGCPSRPSALHPHLPPLPLSLIFRAPFRPLVLLAPLVI